MAEAHLLSNQRPGDPPVLAYSCGYERGDRNATITVLTACEALRCWRCGTTSCQDCLDEFGKWKRSVTQ